MERLMADELKALVRSVFSLRPQDKRLAIFVDFPDSEKQDNPDWKARRGIAFDWAKTLNRVKDQIPLEGVDLIAYPNVHSNNADLPEKAYVLEDDPAGLISDTLMKKAKAVDMESVLKSHQIILAPTEFSPTAPLKLLSKKFGCRAATMPGFSDKMNGSLRLDYEEINRRVQTVKEILDDAVAVDIHFQVKNSKDASVHFDLRYRPGHASGGRLPEPGTAGNLPSGEAYIVPYEGEKGEPSGSSGELPVQFGDEVVRYRIERNRAIEVLSQGPHSDEERDKIHREPAYSNIAEIGFGVLGDFGIKPIGELLLDEKLGLHIAFGRSDHFGGAVGVKDFSAPDKVVHIDRIYIPETQPLVTVKKAVLSFEDGSEKILIENGRYKIFG